MYEDILQGLRLWMIFLNTSTSEYLTGDIRDEPGISA